MLECTLEHAYNGRLDRGLIEPKLRTDWAEKSNDYPDVSIFQKFRFQNISLVQ